MYNRFSSILETNVACGDWSAWVLWKYTTEIASHKLDLRPYLCAMCRTEIGTYICARDPDIRYCRLHAPAQAMAVGVADEESWVLVWQMRAPSTIAKQKTELRRVWQAARWCPDGALDYEPMFPKDVLDEALNSLRQLNALSALRLGLVHADHAAYARSGAHAADSSSTRTLQDEDKLSLEDLMDTDVSFRLPLADTPQSRLVWKYAPILQAFPSLASASLSLLEFLLELHNASIASLAQGGKCISTLYDVLRSDGTGTTTPKVHCLHNFLKTAGGPLGSLCACGRVSELLCVGDCRQFFCASCAAAELTAVRAALAKCAEERANPPLVRIDAIVCSSVYSLAPPTTRDQTRCVRCHLPTPSPMPDAAAISLASLCEDCAKFRVCSHCIADTVPSGAKHSEWIRQLTCLSCTIGVQNLSALATNIRSYESARASHERIARSSECDSPVSASQLAGIITTSPLTLMCQDSPSPPRLGVDVKLFSAASAFDSAPRRSDILSCLILPQVKHINVDCRRLTYTAQSKTWLAMLAMSCMDSMDARRSLEERFQRMSMACVRKIPSPTGDSNREEMPPPMSDSNARFTGVYLYQGEYAKFIIDILVLFCLQGAWSVDSTHMERLLADVAYQCLVEWRPWNLPCCSASHAGLNNACLHEARSMCSTRAPWHCGHCQYAGCMCKPSMLALVKAWTQAPLGVSSMLSSAFVCGHVLPAAAPCTEKISCCNVDCARYGFDASIETLSLSIPGLDDHRPPLTLSRCRTCRFPLSFGRCIFGSRDFVRLSLKRERAALLPRGHLLGFAELAGGDIE